MEAESVRFHRGAPRVNQVLCIDELLFVLNPFSVVTRDESLSPYLSGSKFIYVAPYPLFPGFDGPYQGVLCPVKMLGGVLVLRGVATTDVSALQAHPQMHPSISGFNAVFAYILVCAGNPDLIEM
jgi:hypothetical protein